MKNLTTLLAGFVLLSMSGSLMAQTEVSDEQDNQNQAIEEITVSASRTDDTISTMPNQVTIVLEEEIKRAITISDNMSGVLETTVPGFSGSTSTQTLRGISLRGGNPLILIDGIPQYVSMFDSNKEANPIDMDFVSRVEVIHGASAIQGIGGTGGVINLITKTPSSEDGFSQDVTLRINSAMPTGDDSVSKKIAYTAGMRQGNLNVLFGYAKNTRGMSYDPNGDVVGLVRYSGSIGDTVSDDILLKANYTSGVHSLNIMHNRSEMESRSGWAPIAGCHPNRCSPASVQSSTKGWDEATNAMPPWADNVATSIDYVNQDLFSWKLVAQYYISDFEYRFDGSTSSFYSDSMPPVTVMGQTQVISEKDGFRFTLSKTLNDNIDITLGYDAVSEETSQIIPQNNMVLIPPTELDQSAPFIYANWKINDRFRVNAGARRVDSEVSMPDYMPIPYYLIRGSGPVTGGTTDSTDTIINYGVMFDITDNISMYASVTEGFELAEVGRVVRANGVAAGVTLSNDYMAIVPNIHENTEFGLRYNDGVTKLELSVFEQNAPFGNSYSPNEEGLLQISRLETRRNGYNVSFSRLISDSVSFGLSYAQADAKTDGDSNGSFETDLTSVSAGPPDQVKLYLNFALNDWDGRVSMIKYSDKDFKNTIYKFDGYKIANLNFSREFGNDKTFGVGLYNLFNEEYIDLYSQISRNNNWYVAGTGRTISMSYNQSF